METTTLQAITTEQIAALYDQFGKLEEWNRQQKVFDFYKKKQEKMQHIGFCGHFSAGKSTLLNQLLNQPLLPQSPIPTSANIVEIKNGPEEYVIHFKKREPVKLAGQTPLEQIHALCRDGEEIKKVEIYKEMEELVPSVTLLDTPGIDAADDADRLMTESALHVVDLLFYVIDYNHVQSEVNASFLKQVEAMNKPYIVIINQMDKHNEAEITFNSFKSSLRTVFNQWGISPKAVYFTSLAGNSDPAINQWWNVKETVRSQIQSDNEIIIEETIYNGIYRLVKDSIEEKQKNTDQSIESIEEKLELLELDQTIDHAELITKKANLEQQKSEIEATYQNILEQTVKNAQLMPFDIREIARELLEAYAPGFKLGFFKSKQKTEEERQRRLSKFYNALHKQAEVNLEWKLKDKLTEYLQKFTSVTFDDKIFQKRFSMDNLTQSMNDNVNVTGDYVLVYTDLVANQIKKMYRKYYKDEWHSTKTKIYQTIETELNEVEQHLRKYEQFAMYEQQINEQHSALVTHKNKLEEILAAGEYVAGHSLEKQLHDKLTNSLQIKQSTLEDWEKEIVETETSQDSAATKSFHRFSIDQTIKHTKEVLQMLETVPALQSYHTDLTSKLARLNNRHFTIALFGAFSAGKSSFANALIGENLLPVSPNPTTAAINKISPPTDEYKHEEVKVTVKQKEELLEDLHAIIEDNQFPMIEDAVKWLKKTNINKLNIPDQHKSFLVAFMNGYQKMAEFIGKTYKIDIDQFSLYIQDEQIACFVQEMELFYHCSLTEQNVTLVDTPGADSVNARHTELSFSYIKNADAVLFVTYYNHPFSRPDKIFLEKLGKVKDAFQLDKMFFLVNAVDLAKDEAEVEMVTNYVKTQLQTFDIQEPRMFPISSKMALEEKLQGNSPVKSGLQNFELSFYSFIKEELTQLSMQAIYTDIERVHALVKKWLEISRSDQTHREALLNEMAENEQKMQMLIENRDSESHIASIMQLVSKQCFYVGQRFSIQYTDLFRRFINPGAIQSNGKKGKDELETALIKLHKQINERITYELEAIYIRVETLWNKEWQQYRKNVNYQLKQVDSSFSLSELDEIRLQTPETVLEIEQDNQLNSNAVKSYKDTASFFAKDGRDQLEKEIKAFYVEKIENLMKQKELQLKEYYQEKWLQDDRTIWSGFSQEASSFIENISKGLTESLENVEQLTELDNLIGDINKQLA
ncbi:dynamin family protein [Gracilibacillus xinjiangensis]|uniref:Dynamin family protein n=1 Tax=Gracilibacillus xinjiangensis TaxID=1193282 RepID=A0ABV8X1Z9_9BACI